jgi:hypothetical protein
VSAGRAPIHDELHAVGVAPADRGTYDPRRAHLALRDQRFDLGQLGLLLLTAPAGLRGLVDRDDKSSAPLQPDQPTVGVGLRAQCTVTVLGCE